MTEPKRVTEEIPPLAGAETASYAPYAQLVKMLVPSSACIAVYDASGELIWCSDGYERTDLRELVAAAQTDLKDRSPGDGRIRETASGVTAYVSPLRGAGAALLGCVVIELGTAQSGAKSSSMAPTLLRPVVECLAGHISLAHAAALTAAPRTDDLESLLALDEHELQGADALERLVARCLDILDCAAGAFLVPEKGIRVVVSRSGTRPSDATPLLDRTQKHLLAWAQLNNRPMVVNRIGNEAGMAPYKILSCPVHDPHDRVTGLVALFRSGEAPNFETRDVRILQYVSRKTISILASQRDPLTGLLNRYVFDRRVRQIVESEAWAERGAMLYIDIDRLQAINDAFGFRAGDEVIQRLGESIRGQARDEVLASRVGGDRFAVFMPSKDEAEACDVGASLLSGMANLGYLKGADVVPVSISIGVAMPDRARWDFDHLIAAAEAACKHAKELGRNRIEVYAHRGQSSPARERSLAAAASLRQALQSNELRLQAQPIVDLYKDAGKVLGYEILVRLCDASGALVSPDEFVDAAERYSLMPALDKWVLGAAVEALGAHAEALRELPLGIALNVSAQTLQTPDFPAFALDEIRRCGLPPEAFCFELREASAVNHIDATEKFIKAVTAAGCHISLDDFGSGLSSLAHLRRLKVSYLKIDGGLTGRVLDDIHVESLVGGLAKAAQMLGVLTVAEHVESAAQAEKLRQLEVDLAQGYLYGHPQPLASAISRVTLPTAVLGAQS